MIELHAEIIRIALQIMADPPPPHYDFGRLPIMEQVREHLNNLRSIENFLSLENIVYSRALLHILHADELIDVTVVHEELHGQKSAWSTQYIKRNLVPYLQDDGRETYRTIQDVIKLRESHTTEAGIADLTENEEYSDAIEKLLTLYDERLPPKTLPELLVAHIANLIVQLPDEPADEILLADDFSGVNAITPDRRPGVTDCIDTEITDSLSKRLSYVKDLIAKLEGQEVLYVDINFLPGGYVINLR